MILSVSFTTLILIVSIFIISLDIKTHLKNKHVGVEKGLEKCFDVQKFGKKTVPEYKMPRILNIDNSNNIRDASESLIDILEFLSNIDWLYTFSPIAELDKDRNPRLIAKLYRKKVMSRQEFFHFEESLPTDCLSLNDDIQKLWEKVFCTDFLGEGDFTSDYTDSVFDFRDAGCKSYAAVQAANMVKSAEHDYIDHSVDFFDSFLNKIKKTLDIDSERGVYLKSYRFIRNNLSPIVYMIRKPENTSDASLNKEIGQFFTMDDTSCERNIEKEAHSDMEDAETVKKESKKHQKYAAFVKVYHLIGIYGYIENDIAREKSVLAVKNDDQWFLRRSMNGNKKYVKADIKDVLGQFENNKKMYNIILLYALF